MLIYIHIPFCRKKCRYCAFHSIPASQGEIPETFLATLLKEIAWRGGSCGHTAKDTITSIYLGGGTPSLLKPRDIERILDALTRHFTIISDAEISMEGNPDSLCTPGLLSGIKKAGISRLSIGMQSMHDNSLRQLGRLHTAEQSRRAFQLARQAGFTNISLDLMWNLPGETPAQWLDTLKQAADLQPEHISAYSLTVEDGTPLAAAVSSGSVTLPSDSDAEQMFLETVSFLNSRGFHQYELSNFAREGFLCRHNYGYWLGTDYIGMGPSAVSTRGTRRWTDSLQPQIWEKDVLTGQLGKDAEILTPHTRLLETIMLRLRTATGLPLALYADMTGRDFLYDFKSYLSSLQQERLCEITQTHIRLTPGGFLVSNAIIAGFFDKAERLGSKATPSV